MKAVAIREHYSKLFGPSAHFGIALRSRQHVEMYVKTALLALRITCAYAWCTDQENWDRRTIWSDSALYSGTLL